MYEHDKRLVDVVGREMANPHELDISLFSTLHIGIW